MGFQCFKTSYLYYTAKQLKTVYFALFTGTKLNCKQGLNTNRENFSLLACFGYGTDLLKKTPAICFERFIDFLEYKSY